MSAAIDTFLSDDQAKLELGLRKQVLKKIDILESLQSHGFEVGCTTVCNYIRKKASKPSSKEAFIRQPARQCMRIRLGLDKDGD